MAWHWLYLLTFLSSLTTSLFGSEFMIDTSGIYSQEWAKVAFDGTNYLVVWVDYRNSDSGDIYGARVTPAGVVLDQPAIPISKAPNMQHCVTVAYSGTNYLVVWMDWRNDPLYPDLYGTRVSPDGVVLDPEGIAISTAPLWQADPAVGFDGTNFLVVWEDYRDAPVSYSDIYCARVTPEGKVLDTAGIPVSVEPLWQSLPAVAFDGTNYLAVWADCRRGGNYPDDIYGARITPEGKVLDTLGIPISTKPQNQYEPAIAFDGRNYLVVWTDERRGGQWPFRDIYGARITPQGLVIDTGGIFIAGRSIWQWKPAIVFDGSNYIVVWTDDSTGTRKNEEIGGALVSVAGIIISRDIVVRGESTQTWPRLAVGPAGQLMLVYTGWAGTVGNKTYNTLRVWGKLGPFWGIEERQSSKCRLPLLPATIVKGSLFLPKDYYALLFDRCGEKVADLQPGRNDLRHLSPGVYFVRFAGKNEMVTTKMVLVR